MAGIFKAYDIRGLYPQEIDEAMARRIGYAAAKVLGARTLVAGRDMRLSSPPIQAAAIDGALLAGSDVVNIGLSSTPMLYFAIASLRADGGFNVTASHNPKEYTGFKVCREEAIPLSADTGLRDLERLVGELPPALPAATRIGELRSEDVRGAYLEHVLKFAGDIRPLKVVIDAANGMAGYELPDVLDYLPVQAVPLFFALDGTFPNHDADPLKEKNLRTLIGKVQETGADLGVAFDGDADRCLFVDEQGQPVPADLVTALIGQELLRQHPGAAVVFDLRSSRIVPEVLAKAGGRPVRERVGHSFIKATMRREQAVFGGELSGHYYFAENFYADSGVIAMILMLNCLSRRGEPLSRLVAPLKRTVRSGEINFRVADPSAKIRELAEVFADGEIDYKDGITIQYLEWWCNVRPSNTEPLLRLNLEADTPEAFAEAKGRLFAVLGEPVT